MKQYKVLKEMINAPVGTILSISKDSNLVNDLSFIILDNLSIQDAINQGFIQPYTPEPKHWRAKGGIYWYIKNDFNCYDELDDGSKIDDLRYKTGNYFFTEATAELVAKAQKLMFEWLHDKDVDGVLCGRPKDLMFNLLDAMDDAREAVLEEVNCNEN